MSTDGEKKIVIGCMVFAGLYLLVSLITRVFV